MTSSSDGNKNKVKKTKGAPDYDDAGFWDTKFLNGQDVGEWLNPGDIVLDAAVSHLERNQLSSSLTDREHDEFKPRVLHLGPGISTLGSRLCDAFVQRGWRGDGIVNVDFSAEAIRLGRKSEEEKNEPARTMQWIQADLCSWKQVSSSLSSFGPVDMVLDKSTSDAIATSVPRTFFHSLSADREEENSISPVVQDILLLDQKGQKGQLTLAPVELLGLHLVSLTRKGAIWLVLSYSNTRFDNFPYLSAHWDIVSRTPLKAPSGQTSSASAMVPDVFHWFYVLQRK